MKQKIVARFANSDRLAKGFTYDFSPEHGTFHLESADGGPDEFPALIAVKHLKAIFFVNRFEGDPEYRERDEFIPLRRHGKKLEIRFADGETITAHCESYHPTGQGFFAFPLDPRGNNEKIYVVNEAVTSVHEVP